VNKSAKTSKVKLKGCWIAGLDVRILRPEANSQKRAPIHRKMYAFPYAGYNMWP